MSQPRWNGASIRIGWTRDTSTPTANQAGTAALHHHHAAAQRHRRAAPGPRAGEGAGGRPHPLPAHDRRRRRCGCPAPTTPASRRSGWWSGSCLTREPAATMWAATPSSSVSGSTSRSPAASFTSSRGGWASPPTGSGTSSRWSQGPSHAVRTTFVSLYEKGLIYRHERIINRCVRCATALSDLEVDYQDVDGQLYHIRYPLEDDPEQGRDRRHHPPGDDAGRHRRRRAPRRPALRRHPGPQRRPAHHGPRHPGGGRRSH